MQAFTESNFAWLWIVTKKRASGDGHSFVLESSRRDSNPWSIDYESIALPTEPRKRFEPYYIMIPEVEGFVKRKMKVHVLCYKSPMLRKPLGVMVSSPDQFRYSSLDTHSQNRTFRASLLTENKFARNFVLFMNGRPLRPADLSNFYASMKFVQI